MRSAEKVKSTGTFADEWAERNEAYHDNVAYTYEQNIRPPTLPAFIFFYKNHLTFLDRMDRGSMVLDIGAGTGDFCADLIAKGFTDLTALDVSDRMLEIIRQRFPEVKTAHGDSARLPFPDGSFDFINMKGVLHHIKDYKGALTEVLRCLKPGGYFRLQEPNAKPSALIDDAIERPLNFTEIVQSLKMVGFRIERKRLFLHFQTNNLFSKYIQSNAIKSTLVYILNPLCTLFSKGDIFLIVARKG